MQKRHIQIKIPCGTAEDVNSLACSASMVDTTILLKNLRDLMGVRDL